MSNQIFKNRVPNSLLFELLEKLCVKNTKFYTFNSDSFKKGVYTNDIQTFINHCVEYYHLSKRKYLEKKLTYNAFTTILRQICNFNQIVYTSQIKYNKSSYDIIYYVYYPLCA